MFTAPTTERDWDELAELARRVASRYVPWDRAEDISQEVFLFLWVSDPPREARLFVSALARRLALDHERSERRRLHRERAYGGENREGLAEPEPSGDVHLALRRLPARKRLLAEMLLAGFTVREIGCRLGAPKSSVQREIVELRAQFGRVPSPGSGGRER
jgi:DNA-directed RNA polymerase specialized sigma24 family protein